MSYRLGVLLVASVSIASTAFAQQGSSAQQSGKPSAPVTAVMADRAIAQAFEDGMVFVPVNPSSPILQSVAAAWHAYPQAHYRVQRSGQQNGPWATIHDVTSLGDTINGLPPSTTFFMRVLALTDGGKRGYVVVDSSKPVVAHTPLPKNGIKGIGAVTCTIGSGNVINLSWQPSPGFSKYVVTPFLKSPASMGAPDAGGIAQPSFVVTNTSATYTIPVAGGVTLRVQGRVEYNDWPVAGQSFTYLTPMPDQPGLSGWTDVHLDASGAHCGV